MVNKTKEDKTKYKKLSILIDQGGFSFFLPIENAVPLSSETHFTEDIFHEKSLKIFEVELKAFLEKNKVEDIKLAFANELFCCVPDEFYKEEAKADYLKYNVELFEGDSIEADFITDVNAHLVYVPLMNYHNLVYEQVEEFEYIHFMQSLIEDTSKKSLEGKQKLKVFVRRNQLDIVAFENQKFLMANTFSYSTDLDLVYYILFAVEELKFDQQNMGLYISYQTEESEWLDLLKKYVKHVYSHKENLTCLID